MIDYPDAVWRRFAAPAHAGRLRQSGCRTGRARTPGSDAVLELDLCLDADRISAAAFRVHGCPAAVAAADWACEWAMGKTPAQARGLDACLVEKALGLPAEKRYCGLLAADALAAAFNLKRQ